MDKKVKFFVILLVLDVAAAGVIALSKIENVNLKAIKGSGTVILIMAQLVVLRYQFFVADDKDEAIGINCCRCCENVAVAYISCTWVCCIVAAVLVVRGNKTVVIYGAVALAIHALVAGLYLVNAPPPKSSSPA